MWSARPSTRLRCDAALRRLLRRRSGHRQRALPQPRSGLRRPSHAGAGRRAGGPSFRSRAGRHVTGPAAPAARRDRTLRHGAPRGRSQGYPASAEPDPALDPIFARTSAPSPPSTGSAVCARSGSARCSTRRRRRPTSALSAKWTPFINLKDLNRLLVHLRSVLKREAAALGDVHVDVNQSRLDNSHFVDAEHFSAKAPRPSRR